MTDEKVKHGGCCDCGTKEQKILKSVLLPGETMGFALCDECLKRRGIILK